MPRVESDNARLNQWMLKVLLTPDAWSSMALYRGRGSYLGHANYRGHDSTGVDHAAAGFHPALPVARKLSRAGLAAALPTSRSRPIE